MTIGDFLNDNEQREYPFLEGTVDVPYVSGPVLLRHLKNDVIVDAGFTVFGYGDFDFKTDFIYLKSITRSGSEFTFTFKTNNLALYDLELSFTRQLTADRFTTEFQEVISQNENIISSLSGSVSSSLSSGVVCRNRGIYGFLTTGRLDSLIELLPTDGVLEDGERVRVEPTLVLNNTKAFVTTYSVGNQDRTRVTAPESCEEISWPFAVNKVFVETECQTGSFEFTEGYNCLIRQTDSDLVFVPVVGAGQGEPCEEVYFTGELSISEVPITGGVRCHDVLRSINGKGGRLFQIRGGEGVGVIADTEQHKVTIAIDMRNTNICFDSISQIYESI